MGDPMQVVAPQPGMAPRHGRAYRDIFQLVREQLISANEQPDTAPDDSQGYDGQDA